MNTDSKILSDLRDVVGCNGLRNFSDLIQMRQDTLERRLLRVQQDLSTQSMASIYTSWLCGNATSVTPRKNDMDKIVERCCKFMSHWGIDMLKAGEFCDAWTDREIACLAEPDAKRIKMHMINIRDTVLQRYPQSGRPQKRQKHVSSPVESDQVSVPISAPVRSPIGKQDDSCKFFGPPSFSLNKRNVLSLTLNTKKDPCNTSLDNTNTHIVNFGRLGETISPVPKSYPCRVCGLGGHLVKDCPIISDSELNIAPMPDYICHLCGSQGDHYISSCPKDRRKASSTSLHGLKRKRSEGNCDQSTMAAIKNERGGHSSYKDSISTGEDNGEIKKIPDAKSNPYNCLWRGGWASPPRQNQAMSEPTWGYPPGHVPATISENYMFSLANQISRYQPRPMTTDTTEGPQSPATLGSTQSLTLPEFRMHDEDLATSNPTSPSEPDVITPVEVHVTEKKVKYPDYGAVVVNLFDSRNNTWVHVRPRITALDLWEPKTA